MITATCHFVTFASAVRYYKTYGLSKSDVRLKVNEGLIFIGAPRTKPNERLIFIDHATRYGIETTEGAHHA